jgi:N utilization substance protein B
MSKGIRRKGRELALKAIYGLHDRDQNSAPPGFLRDFWANFRFADDVLGDPVEEPGLPVPDEVLAFAEGLVLGVARHRERIDQVIDEFSTNWTLERMARVDLALLRLATYELLYCPDIPSSVAINEAIEIGKNYGTRETPAFINGILDKISRTHRPGTP